MIDDDLGRNGFQFVASTANIISIYQLINAISPLGDNCCLNITSEGLCFSIVANNLCKILLTLDKRLFSYYEFNPARGESRKQEEHQADDSDSDTDVSNEDAENTDEQARDDDNTDTPDSLPDNIAINIDLKSLLETINIHIPSDRDSMDMRTKCTLSYQSEGCPFILTFEDDYIIERCELLTYFVDPETRSSIRANPRGKSRGRRKVMDSDDELENYEQMVIDNSIFQLDSSKTMFEIVLKSSILYDALKDMNDLNTDEFILYCSKGTDKDGQTKGKKLIFISRSEDSSIGYSKLIVPGKKSFLKEAEVFKPVERGMEGGDVEEIVMVPCSASVSSFYSFQNFAKIIRAIKLSKLIKIRKDMNGLTSFLILIGSGRSHRSATNQGSYVAGEPIINDTSSPLFYGTSIEFITLESIPLEERILTEEGVGNVPDLNTVDPGLRFGYNNKAIESIIQDEENIKVIRITGDGQLTTIDDYFHPASDHMEMPPPSTLVARRIVTASHTSTPLQITEALTRSVLGLGKEDAGGAAAVDVNRTIIEENEQEQQEGGSGKNEATKEKKKKKRGGNSKGRTNKRKKKDNENGIETVGGAIEIPLFI